MKTCSETSRLSRQPPSIKHGLGCRSFVLAASPTTTPRRVGRQKGRRKKIIVPCSGSRSGVCSCDRTSFPPAPSPLSLRAKTQAWLGGLRSFFVVAGIAGAGRPGEGRECGSCAHPARRGSFSGEPSGSCLQPCPFRTHISGTGQSQPVPRLGTKRSSPRRGGCLLAMPLARTVRALWGLLGREQAQGTKQQGQSRVLKITIYRTRWCVHEC